MLPHVIDPVEAMADDAPLLHEEQFTEGVDPAPEKPSNLAKVFNFAKGDVEKGFAEADLVIEHEFDTKPVHQGYIEPQASLASYTEDGQVEVYTATQGHFVIRAQCAKLLQMDISKIRVIPTELGGGFGGKNNVYLETLAIVLSKKSNRPVKMTMSREDVFRATGPDLGRAYPDQDRLPQGRPHHRRRGPARLPGRRLRGLLGADGVDVHLHPLRPRKRQGGRQRHHGEPAQGRRLPGARSADLDLRRRKHPGRDVAGARHRPHRAPPQKTRRRKEPRPITVPPSGRSATRTP